MSFIRGIVFDLDGTLVDSALDFELMRQEMRLESGLPILEAIDAMEELRAAECREILARHEFAGVQRASLMPGVVDFLSELAHREIKQAVLTRNSRASALATLDRLELPFDLVLGREDAPIKPNPAAIWKICKTWGLERDEVVMLGDYRFDIEAGRQAGVRTVLYTRGRDPSQISFSHLADFHLHSFTEAEGLLAWLAEPK
jgi:HAD superfamily hydrolase (TIGR01549 family)